MSDRSSGMIDHRLELPLTPLSLTSEVLRRVLWEAMKWGMQVALRAQRPATRLSASETSEASAEATTAVEVLCTAAEERFPDAWTEVFAAILGGHLEGAFHAGIRWLDQPEPSGPMRDATPPQLLDQLLTELLRALAKAGIRVEDGSAVLAATGDATDTEVWFDRRPGASAVRSGWIADPDAGEARQWWISTSGHRVTLGARSRGSKDFRPLLELRSDEVPVLEAMLRATRLAAA